MKKGKEWKEKGKGRQDKTRQEGKEGKGKEKRIGREKGKMEG